VSALEVAQALGTVIDPELGIDIVSLGLIYGIHDEARALTVEMTMTTPGCPMGTAMTEAARAALRFLRPGASIDLVPVFEPPWDVDMMTDDARSWLGLGPRAIAAHAGRRGRE
jgi:metal-sulfur cluster biosynthetic enzyme